MEISSTILGLKLNDSGVQYRYSYMPFTQSSKLVNKNGQLIAELKRFGWFTLNFKLNTDNGEYLLKCRLSNNELITPQGEVFNTGLSLNFSNKASQATSLRHDSRVKKYAILEVFSDHHRSALIIASCLFTVRYLHGANYSS